jgi:hypothetical protein
MKLGKMNKKRAGSAAELTKQRKAERNTGK